MRGQTATAALRFLGWVEPRSSDLRVGGRARRQTSDLRGGGAGRALVWLLLAEPAVVVTGHPRMRARALATLQRRRQRDRLVTASLGVLVGTALLAAGIVRSPLLAVESVDLVGLDEAQSDAVAAAVGIAAGTNVLDVDLDALAARAEALPWVEVATARRRLPSTIEVRVAVSDAVVAGVVGGTRYLFDARGTAVEAVPVDRASAVSAGADLTSLPELVLLTAPVVGEPALDPGVRAAAAVAAAMPVAVRTWVTGYRATAAGEVEADLRIPGPAGPLAVVAHLGRAEDVAAKAASLAAVVDEALTLGTRITAVDVRIPDRPVARL
jgi:cell division protein FtsQ